MQSHDTTYVVLAEKKKIEGPTGQGTKASDLAGIGKEDCYLRAQIVCGFRSGSCVIKLAFTFLLFMILSPSVSYHPWLRGFGKRLDNELLFERVQDARPGPSRRQQNEEGIVVDRCPS